MSRKDKCLRPGCWDVFYCRGLCGRDYGIAYRLVHEGRTTWAKLEAAGRALPPMQQYRRVGHVKGEVTAWFLFGRVPWRWLNQRGRVVVVRARKGAG